MMRYHCRTLSGTLLACALSLCMAAGAAQAAYLFEANTAKFKDAKKVSSRSFKFLATIDPAKDAEANIAVLRDAVIAAGKAEGYAYKEAKKGDEWRYGEKRYYDTPAYDIYKKGYVIRETYRYAKGGTADPEKFVFTVKEMSPNDLNRIVTSKLAPVKSLESLVKFEENISLADNGALQSYFESAIGARFKNKDLGARTMGDFAKFYPELGKLGIPAGAKFVPVTGYSTQLKFGAFVMPGGDEAKMDIEVWSRAPGGPIFVAEIAFDMNNDEGYESDAADMKDSEDFFLKVFGKAMKPRAMPGAGPYMGSKVRALFDQKK